MCERAIIDENDPIVSDIWKELTELLSENVSETISFLKTCTKKQLFYVSEIFDDISINLKSQQYIDTLYELNQKYPELEMLSDIKLAEEYMKG